MRIVGYCSGCRKIRTVLVGSSALVMAQATKSAPVGVCQECEDKSRERKR